MEPKTQQQYQQAFRVVRELNTLLEPTEIVIDFEKAAIPAFKSEFTRASVKGCFFLFAQANWRKLQESGLAVEYRKDKDLRKKVKSFFALALIPECELKLALEALYAATTANEQLRPYLDYFDKKRGGRNMYMEFYGTIQISNQLYGISSAMR